MDGWSVEREENMLHQRWKQEKNMIRIFSNSLRSCQQNLLPSNTHIVCSYPGFSVVLLLYLCGNRHKGPLEGWPFFDESFEHGRNEKGKYGFGY